MSWQDRDYSDESYGDPVATSWGLRRPPNVTLALMVLHGAAFVLMLMLRGGYGQVAARLLVLEGGASHPVGIILHPVATASLLSIVFVVLAFWSLGGRLEPWLGTQRFVGLYLAGNLAAGVAYFGVARVQPGLGVVPLDYPVGALAGLCLAAGHSLWHEPVQVFGRVTSAGKLYAICGAIVVALAVLGSGAGALAWIAAAAGGAASALVIERLPKLRLPRRRRPRRVVRPSTSRSVTQSQPPDETDIDNILAKISRTGLNSLTEAERQRLEAARRAKLRRPR